MKDTAPKGLGIIAIAALFGIIAAGVALVLYDYQFIGAVFIGGIVAAVTAVVLMLGWREPAPHADAVSAPTDHAASARSEPPAPVAEPEPAAAPEPVAEPETMADTAPVVAPAPAETDAPRVKPSTPLAGQAELAARKGEWKYEGTKDNATKAPAAAARAGDGKPAFLSAAREGGPDDLKQIKGVGKKLEETLHEMGIYHFDQIAEWGPAEQAWMDDNLKGFKGRATRDNWVEQAKTLAAGGTTEFSTKVKEGDVY